MKKRLQNKVSESRLTFPVAALYATAVWLLAGMVQQEWWTQYGCFILSTILMMELNKTYALLRISSSMVSCSFLVLSCCAPFLFPSLRGAVSEVFILVAYMVLFYTYQDKESPGLTYYAFLALGLASIANVHILYLLPVWWLLMLTNLQSLSWRTFIASLLGIATPYWFGACWLFYQEDFPLLASHLSALSDFAFPFDFSIVDSNQIAFVLFLAVLAIGGTLHFWQTSYLDKFRIRQLYGLFIRMDFVVFLIFCLQPQHGDLLIRLMVINTAPLVAHYIAQTSKRTTNIISCALVVTALVLTAYNLWM